MANCKECGSMAINHHFHGRDGSDGDLCDVCYWQKRATQQAAVIEQMREALGDAHDACLDGMHDTARGITVNALTLHPCPEVLNRVRADAMRELYDWYVYQETAIQQDKAMVETFITQRIKKGEA